MTINECLAQKHLTKYRLSKLSNVPYTTINDICSGKAKLEKCSAETVYKIASALDITMENLLAPCFLERSSFELFKSSVCHRVKELGDIAFIIDTLERREIRTYYERKWYPESLYLLAMLDYISRVNDVPLCNDYNDLRQCRLSETLYPSSIVAVSAATKDNLVKQQSVKNAIPEFIRFNIVESEVRNVI